MNEAALHRAASAAALGIAAAFLVVAVLVGALVGAADLNPLATAAALLDRPVRPPAVQPEPSSTGPSCSRSGCRGSCSARSSAACSPLAGAGYQGVFRNPLVDSGMLGASAGAGLGATLAIVYLGGAGPPTVPVAAFAGSLAGVAVAYATGASAGGRGGSAAATLLLAGIAVGVVPRPPPRPSCCSARRQDLQSVYCWLLGSLSAATWQQVTTILPYAASARR